MENYFRKRRRRGPKPRRTRLVRVRFFCGHVRLANESGTFGPAVSPRRRRPRQMPGGGNRRGLNSTAGFCFLLASPDKVFAGPLRPFNGDRLKRAAAVIDILSFAAGNLARAFFSLTPVRFPIDAISDENVCVNTSGMTFVRTQTWLRLCAFSNVFRHVRYVSAERRTNPTVLLESPCYRC